MPSFVNEAGGVALRDASGRLVDVFEYIDKNQSPLIANAKGVSLEKDLPRTARATTPGTGSRRLRWWVTPTPGYANSQGAGQAVADDFVVEPEAITPNGDGMDDFATIRYSLTGPGRVASVRIFDVRGRLVRNLLKTQTIGTDGSLRWEGHDDQGEIVPHGLLPGTTSTPSTARGNTQAV